MMRWTGQRLRRTGVALGAFAVAGGVALGGAVWAVGALEGAAERSITQRLGAAGFDWVSVAADGLTVTLSGTADSEAQRFRALSLAAETVDSARLIDAMEVEDPDALAPPRFSLEILRNDDGVSLIGLVPAAPGSGPIRARIRALTGTGTITDMLETADHPAPEGWEAAVAFGLDALAALERSKISVAADRVAVTATADSRDAQRRLEAQLAGSVPAGIALALDISAPRPVITPFALRFVMDARGARFDSCAADTEDARARILAAGVAAGASGQIGCTLGLGVPSPEWARAVETGLGALAELGAGTLTFADADVALNVPHTVDEEAFDAAAGRLQAALPEVFSLTAKRLPAPVEETPQQQQARFTATLDDNGQVLLRGPVGDGAARDAVQGLARARFGTGAVQSALRLDADMAEGWPRRVMAGLEALAGLHDGRVEVDTDGLRVTGRTGDPEAPEVVARLLADKLGTGAAFDVAIRYDETLDPVAMAPTPERCIAQVQEILAEEKITFRPGAARIEGAAAETLDAIADVLRDCGALPLEIAGHTDSQGRAEMNLALSQRRAEAVREGLAGRRVLVAETVAVGYGSTRPIADNATAAGREANRRIEIALRTPPEPARTRDPDAEADLDIAVSDAGDDAPRPAPRPTP
ncbi:MAG: OmpA family protein [Alkalilacustris sp.]